MDHAGSQVVRVGSVARKRYRSWDQIEEHGLNDAGMHTGREAARDGSDVRIMGSDRILLEGIEFRGYHGVSDEEQAIGGHYSVDLEIAADLSRPGETDRLADTLDYGEAHRLVREIGETERFRLLEALAERMASALLALPNVRSVRLRVRKHRPPLPGVVACAAVEITRSVGK